MDGTFYSSHIHFTQLYTIHGFINGYMDPLDYGLLPNKTQATYERFFGLLKEKSAERHIILNPSSAMMDFDAAASNALTTVFRMVAVKWYFSISHKQFVERSRHLASLLSSVTMHL